MNNRQTIDWKTLTEVTLIEPMSIDELTTDLNVIASTGGLDDSPKQKVQGHVRKLEIAWSNASSMELNCVQARPVIEHGMYVN